MIRLSKSCLSKNEESAVLGVLRREMLGMGEDVRQFEEKLSAFFNRPTVCVINGTAALHLALKAIGIRSGDEVIVPSLTYVASFQAISATGAIPVACDIDIETCTIDPQDAENRITSATKAIMPMYYAGDPGRLNEIYHIAEKHHLRVVEDAAHAFGSSHNSQLIGSFGDISCFSFDGIKNITCGEGGCISTNDKDALQYIKDARLLGVRNDTLNRFTGNRSWLFDVTHQGYRYHMSNIMASIGISQLERFEAFKNKRRLIANYYDLLFADNLKIKPFKRDYNNIVPHIYAIRIIGLQNREILRKKLLDFGIQTGVHYQPCHLLTYYLNPIQDNLPNTENLFSEILSLPLHPDISESETEYIVNIINKLLAEN